MEGGSFEGWEEAMWLEQRAGWNVVWTVGRGGEVGKAPDYAGVGLLKGFVLETGKLLTVVYVGKWQGHIG